MEEKKKRFIAWIISALSFTVAMIAIDCLFTYALDPILYGLSYGLYIGGGYCCGCRRYLCP